MLHGNVVVLGLGLLGPLVLVSCVVLFARVARSLRMGFGTCLVRIACAPAAPMCACVTVCSVACAAQLRRPSSIAHHP